MIIEVKQEHIEKAGEELWGRCPIEVALEEATGESWLVGHGWAARGPRVVMLSARCERFANDYDQGRPVKPFRFRVPVVRRS